MIFSTLFALSVVPSLAYAQAYGGYGGGSSPSTAPASAPSAPANTNGQMNINVAPNGDLSFSPATINAPVGTLVTFYFPVNNNGPHSVTQSSFADPCTYLQANSTSGDPAGFDSGLQAGNTFTINITDTQPIWFHCKQVQHCGLGMVGSINPPSNGSNTHDAFVSAAKAIGANEVTEQNNGPVAGGGVHASTVGNSSGASSLSLSLFTLFAGVAAAIFA
ncbi:hypothetical protein VKT23_008534 [Stygiomarasmius scandens]|uniref:Blue (type 1) copper domain-containing protein n=1 Tax=Marasmiellus scandens TaxID=2682957 RepID=A0ABR1JHL0_9AGAR